MNRLTISMPEMLQDSLKKFAKKRGESVSKIAADAISHYLNMMRRKKLGSKVLDLIKNAEVSANAIEEIESGRTDSDSRV